jgi:uncharacterized BrkB/YihY/UPF0761 family membrane protein
MSKKNKFYWMEGTTKKEIEGLLNNKNFEWLRAQQNRRVLVVMHSIVMIMVGLLVITGFSLLRVSVRGIAEAPDELLDERQRSVRNSNYRYSYLILGYIVVGFMALLAVGPDVRPFGENPGDAGFIYIALLMTMASLPSMVLAWREKDI